MVRRVLVQAKGLYRPYEQIRKKLPDGTGLLDALPSREQTSGDDEQVCIGISNALDGVLCAVG